MFVFSPMAQTRITARHCISQSETKELTVSAVNFTHYRKRALIGLCNATLWEAIATRAGELLSR